MGCPIALIVSIALTGCTYLNAIHVSSDETKDIKGVIYYLPKSEFDITITRTLQSCRLQTDDNFVPKGSIAEISGSSVTGDGNSRFRSEFTVGDWIVLGHQARKVASITNDQLLATREPFTLALREPLPYGKPASTIPKPDIRAELKASGVEIKSLPDKE